MKDNSVVKDNNATLDYQWDWSAWLQAGETITMATITVQTGIVKDSQSNTSSTVTVWLSGGTVGTTYKVDGRITTSLGRIDERYFTISVMDR